MERTYRIALLLIFIANCVFGQQTGKLAYLAQDPPGKIPKLFAPDIVSIPDVYEFGSAFSANGDEFYYAVKLDDNWKAEIRFTKLKEGKWSTPTKLKLDDRYSYNDPFLSPNGKRLYFMSDMPKAGINDPGSSNLWFMERIGAEWSEPIDMAATINSPKNEYYVSLTDKGTVYFSSNAHTNDTNASDHDIYYAIWKGEGFSAPVRMGGAINNGHFDIDPFIAPDESYLIFCSTERGDGFGQGDLYISYKTADNIWSEAQNMGAVINTAGHEFCPFVSRDGKYLFYTRDGNIFWVLADVIKNIGEQKVRQ